MAILSSQINTPSWVDRPFCCEGRDVVIVVRRTAGAPCSENTKMNKKEMQAYASLLDSLDDTVVGGVLRSCGVDPIGVATQLREDIQMLEESES